MTDKPKRRRYRALLVTIDEETMRKARTIASARGMAVADFYGEAIAKAVERGWRKLKEEK